MQQVPRCEDQSPSDVSQTDENSIETEDSSIMDDLSYKCRMCNVGYTSKDRLDNHMASMHLNNAYQCSECKIQFAFFTDMSKHKLENHNYLYFKCCKCDSDFTELYDLAKHRNREHHMIFPCFSGCSICVENRKLNSKETEVEPKNVSENQHLTDAYQCSECNSKFVQFSDMSEHKLEHHNYLYFKCCSCSRNFTEFYDLVKHKYDIHNKTVPCNLGCKICEDNWILLDEESEEDL